MRPSSAAPRILVVDYGMGNLRSIAKALEALGGRVEVSSSPAALKRADGIVFPGDGAFAEAMHRLRTLRLLEPIRTWIKADRPFLGICLGLQVLFDTSEEFGHHRGIGAFAGKIIRFPRSARVPHMGWNELRPRKESWLMEKLPRNPYVYFIHSYFPKPASQADVAATCRYGLRFAAAVERGSVAGVQFHPEKSQRPGLQILRNYLARVNARAASTKARPRGRR
jgi:glutamine amidotransferase